MNKKVPLAILCLAASLTGYSQTIDSTMADLGLDELMNVQVVSASKKSESAFEAPLSIGSVSKEEIQKAGATSIVEALRLIPGILVTEVSNGNYQVDIRGLNNNPPMTAISSAVNSITLVMIDNRPVYNYFNGGTFWETLPVDLNDVERIEVVRGASSPLYGPNAAAGVINIITRKVDKEGMYAVANTQSGTLTRIGNLAVGYSTGKFDVVFSGNIQDRKRTETDYYQWVTDSKVQADSLRAWFPTGYLVDVNNNLNAKERYPDPSKALTKFGYNTFLNYRINDNSSIGLTIGGQRSESQRISVDNISTPLSYQESTTNYADFRAKIHNLNAMVAYQGGTQDAARGAYGYKYDFNTVDAVVEYDIHFSKINFLKNFSFRPGLNFRNASYDDSKYANVRGITGFLNGSRSLLNYAGSLRGEYAYKKFKMIAAVRADKYNHPNRVYTSFQLTPSLKLSEKHFVRANYSRSYRGPNMFDIYNQSFIFGGYSDFTVAPGVMMTFPQYAKVVGNQNLHSLSIDLMEVGYRGKITENFYVDVDVFQQIVQNYSYAVGQRFYVQNGQAIGEQKIENIDLKTVQNGVTVSANYVLNKLQIKPFITVQQTKMYDVPRYRSSVELDSVNNIKVTYDTTNFGSPSVFGGAYINYQISSKFNANVSVYSFGAYDYENLFSFFGKSIGKTGIIGIPSKFLLNARVGYKPVDKLEMFVNVRNALNQRSYEFAQTDKTVLMVLVGLNFKY